MHCFCIGREDWPHRELSKKETTKFIVQLIVSIASAILTALGATSCMGY